MAWLDVQRAIQKGLKDYTAAVYVAERDPRAPSFPQRTKLPAVLYYVLTEDRTAFFWKLDSRINQAIDGILEPQRFPIDISKDYVYHYPLTLSVEVFAAKDATGRQTIEALEDDLFHYFTRLGRMDINAAKGEVLDVTISRVEMSELLAETELDYFNRSVVDVRMHCQVKFSEIVPNIETLVLRESIKHADGTVLYTTEETVHRPFS